MKPVAEDGSVLPAPGKYLETLCHLVSAGRKCFTVPQLELLVLQGRHWDSASPPSGDAAPPGKAALLHPPQP